MTQTVMRSVVRTSDDLQAEINTANQMLVANNTEMMFATLFCALVDLASGAITYCNCGHCPALLLRGGESAFESFRNLGPPLAITEHVKYRTGSIALAPGDMLFLYTDGVTEAENTRSELFGIARLQTALLEVRGRPARAMVEHVVGCVAEFANGAPPSDDLTCVAIVRHEA
jgi:sigma-B regulation protein RsbU (phosphoserine phosphatase)